MALCPTWNLFSQYLTSLIKEIGPATVKHMKVLRNIFVTGIIIL